MGWIWIEIQYMNTRMYKIEIIWADLVQVHGDFNFKAHQNL
jgi:hypothetical protein